MGIFQTSVEKRENHKKEALRTHYYKASFKEVVKAIKKIVEEENMVVHEINETYGDIYLIGDGYEVIVQALEISRMETSVDFKVNYFVTIGLNRPEKKAIKLYSLLDKELQFKGTLLHING